MSKWPLEIKIGVFSEVQVQLIFYFSLKNLFTATTKREAAFAFFHKQQSY